jgi:chromosome segregation ATPase
MEDRIKVLEGELAMVRGELGNLRREMAAMETKARERESQALLERDEAIRNQLTNGVSLLQDQRGTCDQQKELGNARWEEKLGRRQAKDNRWTELQDIVRKIQDDVEGVKNQAEEVRIEREAKPGKDLFSCFLSCVMLTL